MMRNIRSRQSGYAMLLMVVMLMGVGGVVLTGFTQGVKDESEHRRYLHNQRVLQEAKQALLQYAYHYPTFGPNGPGRLPNADTNNDGDQDAGSSFGRLPWAEQNLNLYDIRDADGQRLWYAVSTTFRPQASPINGRTSGNITIRDQSGNVIIDGSNPDGLDRYGIAAVIIAPGAVRDRNGAFQNRRVLNGDDPFDTTPDTDPGIDTETNYLDLVIGVEDNSGFTPGDPDDGLILGPVNGLTNDQMIVITADEVLAMAEMATLEAYRDAINLYRANVGCIGEANDGSSIDQQTCEADGGAWNPVYPWLYNYRGVMDSDDLSDYYPAFWTFVGDERDPDPDPDPDTGYLDNYGRIPSLFSRYFSAAESQPIETWMSVTLTLIDPLVLPPTITLLENDCDSACGSGGNRTFSLDPDPGVEPPTIDLLLPQILTNVKFETPVANEIRVTGTLPDAQQIPFRLYFWGDHNNELTNWTACPGGANEASDCDFDDNRSLLEVSGLVEFGAPGGIDVVINFDFDSGTTPEITWWQATSAEHAGISGTYPGSAVTGIPWTFSSVIYQYDGHWHDNDDVEADIERGAAGDSSQGLVTNMDAFTLGSVTLGMRYYPELPDWAFANGWHDAVRMAYAETYLPSLPGACVPAPDIDPTNDCLFLPDEKGAPRNIASLLVIAGEHDWVDDTPGIAGMEDELRDVFDDGNQNNNGSFSSVRGNDQILVIEEL